jgi:hypothetical protein
MATAGVLGALLGAVIATTSYAVVVPRYAYFSDEPVA